MPKKELRGSIIDIMRYARTAAGIRELTKQSRNWYIQAARNINKEYDINHRKNVLVDYLQSKNSKKFIGKMYMYFYDPKHKKTLPYYDRFPLIFILDFYDDGFLGLNMHYLPMDIRFKLFDQLLTLSNNKSYDETTRLKISYQIISNMKRFKWAKPAIKRYLTTHVKSQMRLVPANEWDLVLTLPIAIWTKASANKVYNDSRKKMK